MTKWITSLAAFMLVALISPAQAADYQPAPGTFQVATLTDTWRDATRDRDVPVKIYYPQSATGPSPVIIFSHGLGGSREGYAYLGEDWAAHGYISVHLQHHGSDQGIFRNGGMLNVEETLRQAIQNPQNSIDRAQDVSFAIDQLEKLNATADSPLHSRLDLTRLGMAGHSFGAATTLLVTGEHMALVGTKYPDPRIKAAIAMSPPMFNDPSFDAIKVPVFVMTGTEDAGFTRTADRRTAFDKISSPGTCLVIFNGADHMTFSGHLRPGEKAKDDKFHPLILAATTAFWDAHLRGDNGAKTWLEQSGFTGLMQNDGKFELK